MKVVLASALGALGAALVATAAVAAGPGAGIESVPVQRSSPVEALTHADLTARQALATDADQYARRFGVSAIDARHRLRSQRTLDRRLALLAERLPDTFAGGWIEHTPTFRAVARFKGAVPAEARSLAGGARVALVGGATRSLEELGALADQVGDDLAARWTTPMSTSFDVRTGTVEATVETPADLRSARDGDLRSLLPQSAQAGDVHVEFSSAPISGDQNAYGGAKISASGSTCTTGFSVFSVSTGTTGVLTAGHCNNTNASYIQPSDNSAWSAPYQAAHRGDWGDFQWHTTTQVEDDEFYSNTSTRRDVSGYLSPSVGDYLCKYGRFSGYGCSTVYRTDVSYRIDGYSYKRLVAMEDNITQPGDSGGPWFLGNDAAGITKGYTTIWLKQRSTFSKIVYIDDALGLGLKTA